MKLNAIQQQVLDGAMLGDGSLIIHKNGINAYLSYLSKSEQHVKYVMNYFQEFLTDAGYYNGSYFDERTGKEYYRTCAKTRALQIFTDQQKRWYKNKIKILPQDLVLTPLVCLIWYIGDGGLIKTNRSQYIKLSTQCFSKEEQEEILLPQLSQFEATLVKTDLSKQGEQQYYIYIPHRRIKSFLDYIGDCPFSDYSYKWNYQEYKNFCLAHNPDFVSNIISFFNLGASAGTIARYLGVDRSTVVKYLKLNGINPKDNAFSKIKIENLLQKGENI